MKTPQSLDKKPPLPNVDALLDRVIPRLKRLRDPERRGDRTDAAASEALTLASMLFNALAGWARDHIIGRSIEGIPRVPYAPGTRRERELGEERPWDDLGLQRLGSEYEFDDPTINKKIIIELTRGASGVFGRQLSFQLLEAIEGLLFGQTYGLVKREPVRLKGAGHKRWHLRFKAVCYVHFLVGTRLKKRDAQDTVADAYGENISPTASGRDTLIQWERRLAKHFDRFLVTDALEAAFNQGTWYHHYKITADLDSFEQ